MKIRRTVALSATAAAIAVLAVLPGSDTADAAFARNRFRGTVNGTQRLATVVVVNCGPGDTRGPAQPGQTIGVKRGYDSEAPDAAPRVGTNDTIRAVLAGNTWKFTSFGTKSLSGPGRTFPCSGGAWASFRALGTGQKDVLHVSFVQPAS